LNGGQTLGADVTAEEIPRRLRHAFDDAFAEHEISSMFISPKSKDGKLANRREK
jgi:hypothetical protein